MTDQNKDILEFYSDAIADQMMVLDKLTELEFSQAQADIQHLQFCTRITDRIHLKTLQKWANSGDQSKRFAGSLGCQEYVEMLQYECDN